MHGKNLFAALAAATVLIPALSFATGRVANVVPVDGGCIAGPTGNSNVQSWDVARGNTYQVTFSNVDNCANGGTDATIGVEFKSMAFGNTFLTATKVSTGTYVVDFTVPGNGCETMPVRYCTTDGEPNSGFAAVHQDGTGSMVHLRASQFDPSCAAPAEIMCSTPVLPTAWGAVKALYR